MTFAQELPGRFCDRFGTTASVCRAPGRVNMIGEHTDYNDGLVLPAAIDFYCWVASAARPDRKLVVHSENFDQTIEQDLDFLAPAGAHHWSDYVCGVAWAIEQSGRRLSGANLLIRGDVPLGAGLSSSAALEVAVGFALLESSRLAMGRKELALTCQRAEREFARLNCGIMDQFVSCHGLAGQAILLDCRSLEFQTVPIPDELQLVICNTMVKHELGASEYNNRRAECEEGVRGLSTALPGIRALRDVSFDQLERHRDLLTTLVYKRCRHVITEINRTRKLAELLRASKKMELADLLAASHLSLRDDYQVSCPELDAMVEIASRQPGVFGARMTGGGFGGCTINLVEQSQAHEFRLQVTRQYQSQTGIKPELFLCKAADGAGPADGKTANRSGCGRK